MLQISSRHNIIHLLIYVVYLIFFFLTLRELFDSLHVCGRCSKENLVWLKDEGQSIPGKPETFHLLVFIQLFIVNHAKRRKNLRYAPGSFIIDCCTLVLVYSKFYKFVNISQPSFSKLLLQKVSPILNG